MPASQTRPALLPSIVLLAVGVGFTTLALQQFHSTTERLDSVISEHAETVIAVERLRVASERIGRTGRSYLLTGDRTFLEEMQDARAAFAAYAAELSRRDGDGRLRKTLQAVEDLERRHHTALGQVISARGGGAADEAIIGLERTVQPLRDELDEALDALGRSENERFQAARAAAQNGATAALRLLIAVAALALVIAAALLIAMTRVLTQLERSRSDLQESYDRLELINRDLDAFAGRIAHDLRNILAPLPMLAARIRSASDGSPVCETAARLEALSRRADRLIESLLAFARGGHVPGEAAAASVPTAIREVLEDVAALTRDVGATIELDLEEAAVQCSPGLLYTVMVNLIGNALKFMNGCPRREMRVSARCSGGDCEVAVSDSGPGIPEAWRTRIFEPFVRVPGASAPGSGIGLATARRIVRAHGGTIEVTSNVTGGSVFTVRLPSTTPGCGRASAVDAVVDSTKSR